MCSVRARGSKKEVSGFDKEQLKSSLHGPKEHQPRVKLLLVENLDRVFQFDISTLLRY